MANEIHVGKCKVTQGGHVLPSLALHSDGFRHWVGYCILERYESYSKKKLRMSILCNGDLVLSSSQKAARTSEAAEKKGNQRKAHYIMVLVYGLDVSLELEREQEGMRKVVRGVECFLYASI